MKISAPSALAFLAALLLAGCGAGSGSSPGSTTPGAGMGAGAGAGRQAGAPNAPAGAEVVTCKGSRVGTARLQATALDCGVARKTMRRWEQSRACASARSDSRSSCALGVFRCQAVRVDRGTAVSCARPGGDVSFIAKASPLRKNGSG